MAIDITTSDYIPEHKYIRFYDTETDYQNDVNNRKIEECAYSVVNQGNLVERLDYQPSHRTTNNDNLVRFEYRDKDDIRLWAGLKIIWGYFGWEQTEEYFNVGQRNIVGGRFYHLRPMVTVLTVPDLYIYNHLNGFLRNLEGIDHYEDLDFSTIYSASDLVKNISTCNIPKNYGNMSNLFEIPDSEYLFNVKAGANFGFKTLEATYLCTGMPIKIGEPTLNYPTIHISNKYDICSKQQCKYFWDYSHYIGSINENLNLISTIQGWKYETIKSFTNNVKEDAWFYFDGNYISKDIAYTLDNDVFKKLFGTEEKTEIKASTLFNFSNTFSNQIKIDFACSMYYFDENATVSFDKFYADDGVKPDDFQLIIKELYVNNSILAHYNTTTNVYDALKNINFLSLIIYDGRCKLIDCYIGEDTATGNHSGIDIFQSDNIEPDIKYLESFDEYQYEITRCKANHPIRIYPKNILSAKIRSLRFTNTNKTNGCFEVLHSLDKIKQLKGVNLSIAKDYEGTFNAYLSEVESDYYRFCFDDCVGLNFESIKCKTSDNIRLYLKSNNIPTDFSMRFDLGNYYKDQFDYICCFNLMDIDAIFEDENDTGDNFINTRYIYRDKKESTGGSRFDFSSKDAWYSNTIKFKTNQKTITKKFFTKDLTIDDSNLSNLNIEVNTKMEPDFGPIPHKGYNVLTLNLVNIPKDNNYIVKVGDFMKKVRVTNLYPHTLDFNKDNNASNYIIDAEFTLTEDNVCNLKLPYGQINLNYDFKDYSKYDLITIKNTCLAGIGDKEYKSLMKKSILTLYRNLYDTFSSSEKTKLVECWGTINIKEV